MIDTGVGEIESLSLLESSEADAKTAVEVKRFMGETPVNDVGQRRPGESSDHDVGLTHTRGGWEGRKSELELLLTLAQF